MIPRDVARHSPFNLVSPQAFRGAREPMMNETQFVEAAGVPTQHIRFDFVDRVPPWGPPQTVDRFPTGPSIDLGCASHMEFGGGLKGLNSVDVVINIPTPNS